MEKDRDFTGAQFLQQACRINNRGSPLSLVHKHQGDIMFSLNIPKNYKAVRGCSGTVLLEKSGTLTVLLCNGKKEGKTFKVPQCHQNWQSCRKLSSSLVQLLTELLFSLRSNTAMPYVPITASIFTWAAADVLAGTSQDSLKALGQQLSSFTNETLEKQTYTAVQVASENPQKKNASQTLSTRSYPDRVR